MDGYIDEVRVYDRPLTSAEINALYVNAGAQLGEAGVSSSALPDVTTGDCVGNVFYDHGIITITDVGTKYMNVWDDYQGDVDEENENNNKNSFGSFSVQHLYGCNDSAACNYDSGATISTECLYPNMGSDGGCTDPTTGGTAQGLCDCFGNF